ncbi:unnamed protein product [Rhizoctonia solani]|uniref:DUF6532 domain-containing protein n=1 Tax=Rhizoctonia solani TaxID=456999 RepID=A0A8H3DH75_9AGAM|nr:unnamed protein product [Rhizoctonia solani]
MRSVTPSHGPIRPHTPNRAACRDATLPYPSPSIRATPRTPLRAIPTRSEVPNTVIRGQASGSTTRPKTPCSTASLSRPSTLAPTTLSCGDLGIAIDVLPGYENLGGLTLRDGMEWDGAAWLNGSDDDDIQPSQASSHSHEPPNTPGERESGASRERTASPAPLLGSYTLAAPTAAEYAINATQEIKRTMDAKKKRGEAGHTIKRIRSITGYTDLEQSCFFIMRVVMFYIWIAKIPWAIEDTEVLELAKTYVAEHTDINVTEVITTDFVKTLCSGTSRLRGEGQRLVLPLVKEYWSITEQDIPRIRYLQEQDRFTCLDCNQELVGRFNTELVGNVMATLMFHTAKKIGILFLHKMMQDDDPSELNRVLLVAAKPGLDGKPQIPTIADTSPQARCGPSISAIAFTCLHIYHALERLKEPVGPKLRKGRSKSGEFGARELEKRWARYVRELAQHPNLGEIRGSLLRRLQKEYMKQCPREEREEPIGNDHLW